MKKLHAACTNPGGAKIALATSFENDSCTVLAVLLKNHFGDAGCAYFVHNLAVRGFAFPTMAKLEDDNRPAVFRCQVYLAADCVNDRATAWKIVLHVHD